MNTQLGTKRKREEVDEGEDVEGCEEVGQGQADSTCQVRGGEALVPTLHFCWGVWPRREAIFSSLGRFQSESSKERIDSKSEAIQKHLTFHLILICYLPRERVLKSSIPSKGSICRYHKHHQQD